MDSSRMLVALGFVVYFLGQVAPAFVPTFGTPRAPPKLGGLPGAEPQGRQFSSSGSAGVTLLAVAAGAVAGATATFRRTSGRSSTTQRRADGSDLDPQGPVVVYARALQEAAAAKGESVPVTKDAMKLLKELEGTFGEYDGDFLHELMARNDFDLSDIDQAKLIIDLLKPCESTVLPKFLIFLAKKKRLVSLRRIMNEYMQTLYIGQSVAPVRVVSASTLSEAQIAAIKEKMKKRLEVDDVKLVFELDVGLLAGFYLEWGFLDPTALTTPSYNEDLSLKEYLNKQAMKEGVNVEA